MGLNLFKSFTLKWWQGMLFKWSILALGIFIGMTWPDAFNALRIVLMLLILPLFYITWVWWRQ